MPLSFLNLFLETDNSKDHIRDMKPSDKGISDRDSVLVTLLLVACIIGAWCILTLIWSLYG